jgi:hypothetical protein
MALILQIFLHSKNQQQDDTTRATITRLETTRLHLKKKIPTTRKSRSEVIKNPNQLKKEQNTDTLSLKLCMPHQALLT